MIDDNVTYFFLTHSTMYMYIDTLYALNANDKKCNDIAEV